MNSSHLDTVNERLRGCGILPTAQRVRIASVLLAAPQHLTADQILAELRNRGEKVSKATVYNTLNLLAGKGVIRQLAVDGDRAWFDSNTAPHFHFQDVDTGALTDLPPETVRFEQLPPPPAGMEYAGIELFIRLRRV
ncbi:MAG: transcriptional repressor [Gammaproteobacteria bacterium]|nr:transcriptional repressor [Gammaproteobacteria bacterium]